MRLAIDTILRLTRHGKKQQLFLEQTMKKQFHSISLAAQQRILHRIGFEVIEIRSAPTAPFNKMSRLARIIYVTTQVVSKLTLGKLLLVPGILIIARKISK
jgi:hypothetical protein